MPKPVVFVAGASAEPGRVRWAMDAIQSAGFDLAIDWLQAIEEEGAANEGLSYDRRYHFAIENTTAVHRSDVLWLLSPQVPSTGSWWELAYAYSSGIPAVISGKSDHCLYGVLGLECDTDEEGLRILTGLCERIARAA